MHRRGLDPSYHSSGPKNSKMNGMPEGVRRSSNLLIAEQDASMLVIAATPPMSSESVGQSPLQYNPQQPPHQPPRHEQQRSTSHPLSTNDLDSGRNSLPALGLLHPERQSRPFSSASLAESESLARGTTSRSWASPVLNAANLYSLSAPSQQQKIDRRPPASIDSQASAQPVIVRSYSQSAWSRSHSRNRSMYRTGERRMDRATLPPLDAFNFDSIMTSIDAEVKGTLDAIADICANNRYSLANQYEVHMPPGGMHAHTFRTLEQSLVPVSEASSERGSASPTSSRKNEEQSSGRAAEIPEPDEAAMNKLLSSSLAGSSPRQPGSNRDEDPKPNETSKSTERDSTQHFRRRGHKPSASDSGVKRLVVSSQSIAASAAFLGNSSSAFKASRSGSQHGPSPLMFLRVRENNSFSDATPSAEGVQDGSIPLASQAAPQIVTDTRTNVVSGLRADPANPQPPSTEDSGAVRAISILRDRRTHDPYLAHFLPSWLTSLRVSGVFDSNRATGSSHDRPDSAAEDILRGILQHSSTKTQS